MRTIRYTNRFKRDYKREKAGRHGKTLDTDLAQAIDMLSADAPLPRRYSIIRCPSMKTGAAGATPVPGSEMPKSCRPASACLLSPGRLTMQLPKTGQGPGKISVPAPTAVPAAAA